MGVCLLDVLLPQVLHDPLYVNFSAFLVEQLQVVDFPNDNPDFKFLLFRLFHLNDFIIMHFLFVENVDDILDCPS